MVSWLFSLYIMITATKSRDWSVSLAPRECLGLTSANVSALKTSQTSESKEIYVSFVLLHVDLHIHKTDKAEYIIITRENLVL